MLKLIRFEFRKLVRNGTFYICTAILIALTALSIYASRAVADRVEITVYGGGLDCVMSAIASSMIVMMLGIFIALYVCEDFSLGTIRNILTRGYSRFAFYMSKFIIVAFVTVIMVVVCCLASYFAGNDVWGKSDASFGLDEIKILLCQLAVAIAYAALFFALSFIIKRMGGSIACCIALPLILTILLNFADKSLIEQDIKLSSYWLEKILSKISAMDVKKDDLIFALKGAGIYLVGCLGVGYLATMKREY